MCYATLPSDRLRRVLAAPSTWRCSKASMGSLILLSCVLVGLFANQIVPISVRLQAKEKARWKEAGVINPM